jgi:hypothetical protein
VKARATAADRRTGPTSTYRDLVIRGFASAEAANLTAYLHELPIEEQPWTLRQVNTVVFLRKLRESGQFGSNDGGARHSVRPRMPKIATPPDSRLDRR